MKENVERNERFLTRHDELKTEIQPIGAATSQTLSQIQAILCEEFNIDGHSYRAWKSRLNLLYKGKYRERIKPYLWQPRFKLTAATVDSDGNVVTNEIITASVTDELEANIEINLPTAVLEAN